MFRDIANRLLRKAFSRDKYSQPDSPVNRGEELACRYLKRKGYSIAEKNYRVRFGEIDIIAMDGETLCFVEVKARSQTDHGHPEEFVDTHKQRKLFRAAQIYLSGGKYSSRPLRFDFVGVDLNDESCRLIKNAFEITDSWQ